MKYRKLAIVLIVLVIVGGIIGFVRGVNAELPPDEDLLTLLQVAALVKTQYIEDVSFISLLDNYSQTGTINGMLEETLDDKYSYFMTPYEYNEMRIQTQGVYGGIGVIIGLAEGDKVIVVDPFPGSPGYEAGLRPGDEFRYISGKSAKGMTTEEAANLLRGDPDTVVKVILYRPETEKEYEVEIVRKIIEMPTVSGEMLEEGIGYVRISSFGGRTPSELRTQLEQLESEGMQGLVLDLRYNPGGLLDAAVEIASMFANSGPVLYEERRTGVVREISVVKTGDVKDYPVVCLVNNMSASASEILSGFLKDRKIGLVIGQQTFGKGLVQTIFPLFGGGALSLTTQRYLTAGRIAIH
ncbi:MAG TPA: S41 family peptidase, partial [Bacillota bacterium]|nr:S41 family peptidase [Bacillota bacterium]